MACSEKREYFLCNTGLFPANSGEEYCFIMIYGTGHSKESMGAGFAAKPSARNVLSSTTKIRGYPRIFINSAVFPGLQKPPVEAEIGKKRKGQDPCRRNSKHAYKEPLHFLFICPVFR